MKKQIEDITKKLEEGVKEVFSSGKYEEFLKVMSKFTNYSFNNCVLISIQMPEATKVAGFKSWQTNFKRNVKKGEKAIKILAPLPVKFEKEVRNSEGELETKQIEYMAFRAVSVFDISQTEGEELPDICHMLNGSVDGFAKLIERLKNIAPVPVEVAKIQGSANGFYSHKENKIVVDADLSEIHMVKTLVHEIAHSMIHNENDGEQKEADSRTKEVQAESIAYAVCNYMGLDTSDWSFGYIAGWSEGKELKELQTSMDVIRKTAGTIIEKLEEVA